MEETFNFGVIVMETYKKPVIVSDESAQGAYPAVAIKGFALALARGKSSIDSTHTQALPRKKTQD